MSNNLAPVAVWTAGALYYTYFTGEVMRLFDVADVIVMHWTHGLLTVSDERYHDSLDRLFKKRGRRVPAQERAMLYKRVFNIGEGDLAQHALGINERFPMDWNRLMKGVTAYLEHEQQGVPELADVSRTLIEQATRDMQSALSAVMSGTSYLMAAEIYTLLRETMDLLKSEEIQQHFGSPDAGTLNLVSRITADHFSVEVRTPVIHRLAESGSHILQDWVARFGEGVNVEQRFSELLVHAQDWMMAYAEFQSGAAGDPPNIF